jgi:hypothetical protein
MVSFRVSGLVARYYSEDERQLPDQDIFAPAFFDPCGDKGDLI